MQLLSFWGGHRTPVLDRVGFSTFSACFKNPGFSTRFNAETHNSPGSPRVVRKYARESTLTKVRPLWGILGGISVESDETTQKD